MTYGELHDEDNLHVMVVSLITGLVAASDGLDVLLSISLAHLAELLEGDGELVEELSGRGLECD